LGLFHVLLLNGQLILGVDLSQGYSTSILTEQAGAYTDGFVTTLGPRVAGRLLYPMSEYQLEYQGGLTVYDFDPSDNELSHQAELRGNWQLGETTQLEAIEQVQYGSGNTLRQLDTASVGITELAAARTRYILNHGRLTLRSDIGTSTSVDGTLSYLLRRSLDDPAGDVPVFNYDTFAPEADVGITRHLDDDNQVGLRVHYNQYFTPPEARGNMFDDAGRIAVDGMLMYGHRFYPRWQTSAEAGVIVSKSLEDENDSIHVEPAGALNAAYTNPYLTARARYTHGFGAYGATTAGTARFDAVSLGFAYNPDPLRTRLSIFGTADARVAREAVADLSNQHYSVDTALGVRYELNDYIRLFGSYEWRYQYVNSEGNELDDVFKRHVFTVGVSGEYAIPRRLDEGESEEASEDE
jgi:hypothetical protein